jgi:amino acid adenylation domain-containing protein
MKREDDIAKRRANLSPAKRALLESRLKAGTEGSASPLAIPVQAQRESLPLSFAQEQQWLLNRLAPESAAYNVPRAYRLTGPLNREALERSLTGLARRHESLRTTFPENGGEPTQRVGPAVAVRLPFLDVSRFPEAEREAEARKLAAREAGQPFDLETGPLFRAHLIGLAEDDHVLLLTMHHIISDEWSMGVCLRDLLQLYGAFCEGTVPSLAPLAIQCADHAAWQRLSEAPESLDPHLEFFKEQLAGAPPVLELPCDRPRPAVQTFRGAQESFLITTAIEDGLKSLALREETTLFMVLMAALCEHLHRYACQDDIVVGFPVAGRNRVETEGLIGTFVNTVALRTDLSGNPSFRALLRQVREKALGAYAHQDAPFAKLVEVLQPDRDTSHSPVYQVLLNLKEFPGEMAGSHGLAVSEFTLELESAQVDLTLEVRRVAEGLRCRFIYSTDLFDAATVRRMCGHFEVLARGIVATPDARLSDLPFLTDWEREQILVEWNGTRAVFPVEGCLHQLFEERVRHAPGAVAVTAGSESLTYGELNARANQVARYLRKRGVGPDVLVGICVEPSLDLVAGLLGVLKAGGAYLPLDPSYPPERMAFMLEESGAPVVLTQEALAERLGESGAELVCLDTEWGLFAEEDASNPAAEATPGNLAYVIYTSGSTGRPKGVPIAHSNVVRLFLATEHWFHFNDRDVWTLFHSYAFDFSVWELWGALLHGGRLVVVPRMVSRSPEAFCELLERERVTVLNQTPSAFRQLMHYEGTLGDPRPLSLRYVMFGGEALDLASLGPWVERHGDERPQLLNLYGITETTVHVTYRRLREADVRGGRGSVIGVPIPDLQVYLLDPHRQLVPVGVPGEVYVGGAGVGRGYLNRPELTAERFIPNPFSDEPGALLYKAGDLCRWLPDGDLEYLGRIDDQVQVRGFRVELGEVESAIGQHGDVREVVVITREDRPDDKRLVAYMVRDGDSEPPVKALLDFLKTKLPDYMIPSAFVFLESLPLTRNGKVDRRALPAPDHVRLDLAEDYVPPRTPTETTLARIWADLLGVDRVGMYDSFFDLGGHSLLATRMMSRVRDALGSDAPLRVLFDTPTVAHLAEFIEAQGERPQGVPTTPIRPVPRAGALPMSFGQEGLWYLHQMEPELSAYNIAEAYRIVGRLDLEALRASLNEVVQRHEALRTTFAMVGGQPCQVVAPECRVELPMEDLSALPDSEREARARDDAVEEAKRPLDLDAGPLFRFKALRLDQECHLLLLTIHHIVSDGWSQGVFMRDLLAVYEARAADRPSPLPALPLQYADFTVWQRERYAGPAMQAQISYWKERLAGPIQTVDVLADRPRPEVQTFRGATHAVSLSSALTESVAELSRGEGVTPFMTLLAAVQTLLHRYTGFDDIMVGSPIANRQRGELEDLVGLFTNTLALRTDFSGEPTCRELLGRVKEVVLGAYANQAVPFEKIVQELHVERDPGRNPLVQVMFAFQNYPAPSLGLPGLRFVPEPIHNGTAKFDLILFLYPKGSTFEGTIEYNVDLFEAATIERMARHFETVLAGMAATPDSLVWELPLLQDDERRQMLSQWNDTASDYPREADITRLFEARAQANPGAAAIVAEGGEVTYGQLNARANQIARRLQGLGVAPGHLVGICMERSADMVLGLLAILKAGAAYVPVDSDAPSERLAVMLNDAQASLVLTQESLVHRVPDLGRQVVCLDALGGGEASRLSRENLECRPGPEDLAYVAYTSGSTGTPKGICIPHRAVVRLVADTDYLQLAPADVVAQASNIAFDAATFEVWGALINGARLVILTKDTLLSPSDLEAAIESHGITAMFLTTALFNQMARLAPAAFRNLRHLLVGGEEVTPRWMREVLLHGAPQRLLHVYGPTESTTFATWHLVTAVDEEAATVPIGRPIANTEVYVLDRHLQPVPIGVPGELCLGGDGLARGYLDRPELTAEKFIPHPFRTTPGARLYRTGDMARFLPNGGVVFLGRQDGQVKIRGFRIELGEIEAVLAQCPGVRDAVVLVREDGLGDKRLIGYVVGELSRPPGPTDMRAFLEQRLPGYMVPTAHVLVKALPLTANGKVDREALASLEPGHIGGEGSREAPATATAVALSQRWEALLHMHGVGVRDNFFDLGGHSLLAVQAVEDIRNTFGITVTLRDFLANPTIERMSALVEARQGETPGADGRAGSERADISSVVPLREEGSEIPLFCVTGAADVAEAYSSLVAHLKPTQPFYGLQESLDSLGREDALGVEALAGEFVRSMREVQPNGPYCLGGWSFGGLVAFEMAQQLSRQGEEVRVLALIDCEAHLPETPWIRRSLTEYARRLARRVVVNLLIRYHCLPLMIGRAGRWARSIAAEGANLLAKGKRGQRPRDHLWPAWEEMVHHYEFKMASQEGLDALRSRRELVQDPYVDLVTRAMGQRRDAIADYYTQEYRGPITFIRTRHDPWKWGMVDRTCGWAKVAKGGLDLHVVPGDHMLVLREPHVRKLAETLQGCLDRSGGTGGSGATGTGAHGEDA